MELRPLDPSHDALLRSLQEQDDVWEFVGPLPDREEEGGDATHLFAVVEGQVAVGIGGLVKSQALEGHDLEVLCALRSDAQRRGLAKHACQLILAWAFDTAKVERVIACIDDDNEVARSIAATLGMQELRAAARSRTVYVKYRDGRRLTNA
jgi:RimJ/RimL family protein N-acetyltransferase